MKAWLTGLLALVALVVQTLPCCCLPMAMAAWAHPASGLSARPNGENRLAPPENGHACCARQMKADAGDSEASCQAGHKASGPFYGKHGACSGPAGHTLAMVSTPVEGTAGAMLTESHALADKAAIPSLWIDSSVSLRLQGGLPSPSGPPVFLRTLRLLC